MKDWKDYVGFQPIPLDSSEDKMKVFYLQYEDRVDPDSGLTELSLCVNTKVIAVDDFKYTDENIEEAIKDTMFCWKTVNITINSNPTYSWEHGFGSYNEYLPGGEQLFHKRHKWLPYVIRQNTNNVDTWREVQKLKNTIATNTSRGKGNTTVDYSYPMFGVRGKLLFYQGTNIIDRPIMVAEYNDKYAIFTHPDFNDYGFNVNFEGEI